MNAILQARQRFVKELSRREWRLVSRRPAADETVDSLLY